MPITSYPHNFLLGLSDFWQRFFADAAQLKFMYDGSAVLMGQAYLDMLENVLGLSLQDVPVFHREYFYLLTIREDQVRFERGAALDDDRWLVTLTDGLVNFKTLDNKVLEPTASLQEQSDYDLSSTDIRFKVDPTDPAQDGTPLPGYARRAIDAAVGGFFDDTTRPAGMTWMSRNVRKGDTLRLLDIGPDPLNPQQRKRSDHTIVLVREKGFYVSPDTPLTTTTAAQNYVVLRRPYNDEVELADLVFSPTTGLPAVANLAHTRVDQGSVRVYGRRAWDGQDVVEGVDYTIDYELGKVYKLANTTVNPGNLDWIAAVTPKISYTWQQEVWPVTGITPPRFSPTGVVRSSTGTARVLQIALWALDASIDKKTLANNFGSLIGSSEASSESYRALLRGIYQLYMLGPVLERIESALNVILGFPVVRDDGETIISVDQSLPDVTRVKTLRPSTNTEAVYDYPKNTPIRADIIGVMPGSLTFSAFEPLTTAITITDYIEDPTWWHNTVIPENLFSTADGAVVPEPARRTASPSLVKHVCGAEDTPKCGDPGLVCGADEDGVIPPPGHPVYRHRLAFILFDRFLKHHTFSVKFDPAILSGTSVGSKFSRTLDELNGLVRQAKPAHTFVFVTPATQFDDPVQIAEDKFYQPQRFLGADPDATELYLDSSQVPNPMAPYTQLGVFFKMGLGGPAGGADKILFEDNPPIAGSGVWRSGDYYHYELHTDTVSFPTIGIPVSLAYAPVSPRRGRFVQVYVGGTKSSKRLVENVDYTIDYANRTVTRLTTWDTSFAVAITFVQLNIGNLSDVIADQAQGDTAVLTGGIDPARERTSYDPAAVDWFGNLIPVINHRDLSLVEHPLTLKITSQPSWSIQTSGVLTFLQGVTGFSDTDVYSAGDDGWVTHWNGTTWTAQQIAPGCSLYRPWGASASSVWVCGTLDSLYKSTDGGITWVAQTPPTTGIDLYGIWGSSSTDFWVATSNGYYHTTDGGVSYVLDPASTASALLQGSSASDIVNASATGFWYYDGVSWVNYDVAAYDEAAFTLGVDKWFGGAGGGGGMIRHWDTPPVTPTLDTIPLSANAGIVRGIYGTSVTDVYAAASGVSDEFIILKLTTYNSTPVASVWTEEALNLFPTLPTGYAKDVWVSPTGKVWVVGGLGRVAHYG